jgi:sugar lactone lactonase YvrE
LDPGAGWPDGFRIGNLCFGGADGRDLYIAATSSLYRIKTATRNTPGLGH